MKYLECLRQTRRPFLPLLACLMLSAAACSTNHPQPPSRNDSESEPAQTSATPEFTMNKDAANGLTLVMSETQPPDEGLGGARLVEGTPLDEAALQAIYARLDALPQDASQQTDFALRTKSLPAPRTGDTLQTSFPPDASLPKPAAETGPFELLRFAPEGDVTLAPKLSLTFSRPVVALSGQEDAAKTAPATIAPQVDGKWRWVGTRTALFEPTEPRFAMATDYTVTVDPALKSATGDSLDKPTSWTFSTPPLSVVNSWPSGQGNDLDPIIFLAFDQRIEPDNLLKFLTLTAKGEPRTLMLASTEEVQNDARVRQLVAQAQPGRWIALKSREPLPPAATIRLMLNDGAPSAEGPRRTTKVQAHTFKTFDPLRIEFQSCESSYPCQANSSWWVSFNNQLDEEAFSAQQITVEPPVTGLEVSAQGAQLRFNGQFKGRTTYKVSVDETLKDTRGQTLGETISLRFHVGPAPKQLGSSASFLTTLDPALNKRFPFFSTNYDKVRVRAWRVHPTTSDWVAYSKAARDEAYNHYRSYHDDSPKHEMPGKLVVDKTLPIEDRPDAIVETFVDLKELLGKDAYGHLVLWIEPVGVKDKETANWRYEVIPRIITWVQVSDIALHGFLDQTGTLAWASNLADGTPLKGAHVGFDALDAAAAATNAEGLATLKRAGSDKKDARIIVAKNGADVAILPIQNSLFAGAGAWRRFTPSAGLLWYLTDDRGIYKPGETARVKGWVRQARRQRDATLRIPPLKEASYLLRDARYNTIDEGSVRVDEQGGFDFELKLPDNVNLGTTSLEVHASFAGENTTAYHSFQIQEFRRPEFEVSVSKTDGPYLIGGQATVSADAHYYAGGGLPGAPITWTLKSREGRYTPPGHGDYTFGRWSPWWWWGASAHNSARSETFTSITDASGQHHLQLHFTQAKPALPMTLEASPAVQDVNRQTWSARTNLLVHPADFYVGLKSRKNFVESNEPIEVDAIATDIDGKITADRPIKMVATRLEWRYKNGEYHEEETERLDCDLTSAKDAQTCTFKPQTPGSWLVRATVFDDFGRPSQSEVRVWVGSQPEPPKRRAEIGQVRLIPEQENFKPGDTAKIMALAPFPNAQALLTVRQNGIVRKERFQFDGVSHPIAVKISELDYPNVYVQVDLVGKEARTDASGKPLKDVAGRPAWARGSLNLQVPPITRELAIDIAPQKPALNPGQKTWIDLTVKTHAGKPAAGAQVLLIAVDEAILALSGYTLQNPIDIFYAAFGPGVTERDLHTYLVLAKGDEALEPGEMQEAQGAEEEGALGLRGVGSVGRGGGGVAKRMAMAPPMAAAPAPMAAMMESAMDMASGDASTPIAVRSNFDPLAAFAPAVTTDAQGKARVDLTLPDNLTRYRLMAVAVQGADHFGKAESNLTARLPLMVRPSPPRFLNYGDRVELPVVVQNQTDAPMKVHVAMRAANLGLEAMPGRAIEVPAHDRVEVRFKAVSDKAGTAHIQVAAVSGNLADAATNTLPVWTPATTEAFATYGTLDKDGEVLRQPTAPPKDAIAQFGGMEITTSSTALQSLTDALIYLVEYPFDCSEQIASRILGVSALRAVLDAFQSKDLPEKKELIAAMQRDIEMLGKMQRYDGGFYLWSSRDWYRYPFVEVHVTHALWRAKQEGFEVPKRMLERAQQHIASIEQYIPSDYSVLARNAVLAYALYVRNKSGESVHAQARALAAREPGKELSLEAIGWLMSTLKSDPTAKTRLAELTRYLQNRVDETAATAQFTSSYGDGAHVLMHSSRRTDAILLDAWMDVHPKSDLTTKLVEGLLAHRTRGHWLNTQENVFVLLALDHYFKVYEKETPDFVANVWLGDGFAGSHTFKGRSTDYQNISIPMQTVVDKAGASGGQSDLTLQKVGKGRMYYRLGMDYALKSLKLDAAEYGFSVSRDYEGVDDPKDVQKNDDGTWQIKLGSRVRVRVTMVAPARRYHVALVDPMPAGLEPINPALAVSEDVPQADDAAARPFWWWYYRWYSHQNLRDERAEAFGSLVYAGTYEYTYVTRATTPGEFVVPPAKAEEMYHPETFGRSASTRVVIK